MLRSCTGLSLKVLLARRSSVGRTIPARVTPTCRGRALHGSSMTASATTPNPGSSRSFRIQLVESLHMPIRRRDGRARLRDTPPRGALGTRFWQYFPHVVREKGGVQGIQNSAARGTDQVQYSEWDYFRDPRGRVPVPWRGGPDPRLILPNSPCLLSLCQPCLHEGFTYVFAARKRPLLVQPDGGVI